MRRHFVPESELVPIVASTQWTLSDYNEQGLCCQLAAASTRNLCLVVRVRWKTCASGICSYTSLDWYAPAGTPAVWDTSLSPDLNYLQSNSLSCGELGFCLSKLSCQSCSYSRASQGSSYQTAVIGTPAEVTAPRSAGVLCTVTENTVCVSAGDARVFA